MDILLGLFIGLAIGVNAGILGCFYYNFRRDGLKALAEQSLAQSRRNSGKDPFDVVVTHSCMHCHHQWKEHHLLIDRPNYCPKCGKSMGVA